MRPAACRITRFKDLFLLSQTVGGVYRTAIAAIATAIVVIATATAGEPVAPRYELYFSPDLDAESGARLVSSALTGTGAGEQRLFRPLGAGAGGAVARAVRGFVWDAPVAW